MKHLEAFMFSQKYFICTAHYVETTGKVIYLYSYKGCMVIKPYHIKVHCLVYGNSVSSP